MVRTRQAAKAASSQVEKAPKKGSKKEKKRAAVSGKAERHALKIQARKKAQKSYTAADWSQPAPSHLVAKLDVPKVTSKYQSYFEFADNTEKKKKKLEYQVTDNQVAPPGFTFVPIGDPAVTNACKELSRERGAMIFIVSNSKEENSKISEHIHRTGYHFRESIVEEAREIIGETIISRPIIKPGYIEPIPHSQDDINKQADAAIRDLFPRIPNIDRTMIIEHAFQKGSLFHGEPTVGLQTNIPLSRRVQLAVLAHIRHTHTRYDKLLRETSWMNARKAVEPVCLDVLVKWRGDEETGRDQMDEILREVVIITDSEGEEDSSEDDSTDEDGEVTSASSTEAPSFPISRDQHQPSHFPGQERPVAGHSRVTSGIVNPVPVISSRTGGIERVEDPRDKRAQRGFNRYQAAWDGAKHRMQAPISNGTPVAVSSGRPQSDVSHKNHDLYPPLNSQTRPEAREQFNNTVPLARNHSQPIQRPVLVQYHPGTRLPPTRIDTATRVQEIPTYYQHGSQYDTPVNFTRDTRPSPVVRASPSRGLQDMLLSSIETSSSNVPARQDHCAYDTSRRIAPESGRLFEHRRHSPAQNQVIVIDSESPQYKRRRVIPEDIGTRSGFVSSRDEGRYIQPQSSSSSLQSPSYVHPRELSHSTRVSYPSTQGILRSAPTQWTSPAGDENLPIYDAPGSGSFTTHPNQLGRSNMVYRPVDGSATGSAGHMVSQPYYDEPRDQLSRPRPDIQYRRERVVESGHRLPVVEYNQRDSLRAHSSALFPVESRVARPLVAAARPFSTPDDQDFIHSFSQSRLDGPVAGPRQGYSVNPERSHQDFSHPGNRPQAYDIHPKQNYENTPPTEREQRFRRAHHPEQQPISLERPFRTVSGPGRYQPPPPQGGYISAVPRNKVIVID